MERRRRSRARERFIGCIESEGRVEKWAVAPNDQAKKMHEVIGGFPSSVQNGDCDELEVKSVCYEFT